jgi:RNA polymerase sigma-70 factor (ECF subfamily)
VLFSAGGSGSISHLAAAGVRTKLPPWPRAAPTSASSLTHCLRVTSSFLPTRQGELSDAAAIPEWVEAARTGDIDAMDALYRRFAPVVHGILLAYVLRADADDLTQDVFETAIRRLGELREAAAFPGWIVSIARRAALDAKRRPVPLTGAVLELERAAAPDRPDEHLEAEHALRAIADLPEAYRETLLLRLVEGLTGPEIAERTGLTPGSVRVNLHRGMAMLRAALGAPADVRGATA